MARGKWDDTVRSTAAAVGLLFAGDQIDPGSLNPYRPVGARDPADIEAESRAGWAGLFGALGGVPKRKEA